MSEFLAKRITMRFIRKFQIKEEDWDLYYLGIEVIVTTALTSLMIMALGIALRNFFGSVVFLLCFMSIRGYCGGYHAKTRVRCFFVSILCYLLSFGMMKGLLFLPEIAQNILITIGVATAYSGRPFSSTVRSFIKMWLRPRNALKLIKVMLSPMASA